MMLQPLQSVSSQYCPSCGSPIDNMSKFCGNCGQAVEAPAKGMGTEKTPQQPQTMSDPPSGRVSPNPSSQGNHQPPVNQYTPNSQAVPNQYGQHPSSQQQPPYGQTPYNQNQSYQQGYQTNPNQGTYIPPQQVAGGYPPSNFRSNPNQYIIPPNYQNTTTIWERIMGTLKADVHVVEEIERRKDLQDEAQKLLIINFTVISFVKILSVLFFSDLWVVVNPLGAALEIILNTFGVGFLYIILIAEIGDRIGGATSEVDREEIIRVLAYAYVAFSLADFISLVDDMLAVFMFTLFWLVAFFYSGYVFIFAVRRSLDSGWGVAILTVLIALFIRSIVSGIIDSILIALFGGTYY